MRREVKSGDGVSVCVLFVCVRLLFEEETQDHAPLRAQTETKTLIMQ